VTVIPGAEILTDSGDIIGLLVNEEIRSRRWMRLLMRSGNKEVFPSCPTHIGRTRMSSNSQKQ